MRVLGIETSTQVVSVAICEEQRLLGEVSFNAKQEHMQRLIPMIDSILRGCGMEIADVDAFAVSVGPGSFTSLRVGLATAKAFAHALFKPLVGVPTLDALAWELRGNADLVCTLLEARRDEVYACFYISTDEGMRRLSDYMAISPLKLAERLQGDFMSRITFTGEGALAYWGVLQEKLGERAMLADPIQLWPRAAAVARLGYLNLVVGSAGDARTVTALYVKPPAIRQK
ncbi:MAG: tRNA (adenosine(37)-N6)-threonylcarbamoyltransferase complex dimerization subunit type 1 TsaB [Thermacetogeniaceae bacterium]